MFRRSVTDQEIRDWVYRQHGLEIEPGWIAHCRELCGISEDPANRTDTQACPPDVRPAIKQAFRHFGMLS